MTIDYWVIFCSKNCPSKDCKHRIIHRGEIPYEFFEFKDTYINIYSLHRHRVRNVLKMLQQAIEKMQKENIVPAESPFLNATKENLKERFLKFLIDMMQFISSCSSGKFIIASEIDKNVKFIPFEDETTGYNIHGIYDGTSSSERDDDSYPQFYFTKNGEEICLKTFEEMVEFYRYIENNQINLLKNLRDKAMQMKGSVPF